MKIIKTKNSKDRIVLILLLAAELFALGTLIRISIYTPYITGIAIASLTVLLCLFPILAQRFFLVEFSLSLHALFILYALGALFGECYGLYSSTRFFDKAMHFTGGIVFAILGVLICCRLARKEKNNYLFIAAFALSFSIAIAAIWEFYEFGSDLFFGTNMQKDKLLTIVMDQTSSQQLDIGLYDTMYDMLIETVGALFFTAYYCITRGRHIGIERKGESNEHAKNTGTGE